MVSDGGEHLSAVTNTFQIIGNIVLSYILAGKYGIIGIAAGTVICKAAFVFLILLWFITGKSSIPFFDYVFMAGYRKNYKERNCESLDVCHYIPHVVDFECIYSSVL